MKALPFIVILSLTAAPALMAEMATPPAARPPFTITPSQKARLLKALEGPDRQYDPQEKMLKKGFGSPGYHTTLTGGTVHPTRDALGYAVALLDTGEPERLKRAEGQSEVEALRIGLRGDTLKKAWLASLKK
jgi:hypothetical protein